MSKAILVIDTPKSCQECPLNNNGFCIMTNNCTLKHITCHPDWCPLKAIPERYDNISCDGSPFYNMCVGWNACIDELI